MRGGFFSKVLTFVATVILFKLRGKKSVVRFGGRAHPLLTVGFLQDVVMYMAASVAVLVALATVGIALFVNDPQLPLMVVSGGAFIAGLIEPKKAWRWWLILAVSIPLAFVIGEELGISSSVAHWKPRQAILAASAPFLAVYVAALLRGILRRLRGSDGSGFHPSATAR